MIGNQWDSIEIRICPPWRDKNRESAKKCPTDELNDGFRSDMKCNPMRAKTLETGVSCHSDRL
ncbi:MAG: hypothetical protein QNJ18_02810 [Xenococcaceae cyanobacterium MO_167.B52]|nr:hypothetical protein [Xenococcaceae cyanobacterium MO_167.B52]